MSVPAHAVLSDSKRAWSRPLTTFVTWHNVVHHSPLSAEQAAPASGVPLGVIIGAAVGAVALAAIVGLAVYVVVSRRNHARSANAATLPKPPAADPSLTPSGFSGADLQAGKQGGGSGGPWSLSYAGTSQQGSTSQHPSVAAGAAGLSTISGSNPQLPDGCAYVVQRGGAQPHAARAAPHPLTPTPNVYREPNVYPGPAPELRSPQVYDPFAQDSAVTTTNTPPFVPPYYRDPLSTTTATDPIRGDVMFCDVIAQWPSAALTHSVERVHQRMVKRCRLRLLQTQCHGLKCRRCAARGRRRRRQQRSAAIRHAAALHALALDAGGRCRWLRGRHVGAYGYGERPGTCAVSRPAALHDRAFRRADQQRQPVAHRDGVAHVGHGRCQPPRRMRTCAAAMGVRDRHDGTSGRRIRCEFPVAAKPGQQAICHVAVCCRR